MPASDYDLSIRCPSCARTLRYPQRKAGRRVNCPRCGTLVALPPSEPKFQPASKPATELKPEQPTPPEPVDGNGVENEPPIGHEVPVVLRPISEPTPKPVAPANPRFAPRVFRPRRYVALSIISILFYVLAGMVALAWLWQTVLVFFGSLNLADEGLGPLLGTGVILLAWFLVTIIEALVCVCLVACGQLIRLLIDVQANTQRAAWLLSQDG